VMMVALIFPIMAWRVVRKMSAGKA
jgi:hypothetical protein